MKLYWDELADTTQVYVLISEYVHLKNIEELERLVLQGAAEVIEDKLLQRGVIWDRNHEFMGSEHLYIDSAVYHVQTYARARRLSSKVVYLLRNAPSARTRLVAPVSATAPSPAKDPMIPLALFCLALLAMASVAVVLAGQ